ncbi:transposase [Candidatus Saganbacteria bacterium]|nr:transposase [Candidatus Saganbacteria bacterium]
MREISTECCFSLSDFYQIILRATNEKVTADFKGGKISSDGGLVLLREFDQRMAFIQGF